MSRLFLIIFLSLCGTNVIAQKPSKTKLVVGIVVDQMRWDYLYRFQNRYGNAGFNRLLKEGFNCQNTYLNYVPS